MRLHLRQLSAFVLLRLPPKLHARKLPTSSLGLAVRLGL